MTREDKIKLAIERGFTYDELSGKIYGIYNKEITGKMDGYIVIGMYLDKKKYQLKAHQFGYYMKYGRIVDCIDHINGIKDDNRICNLREVTHQENDFNKKNIKGYCFYKTRNNYKAEIGLNGKSIFLGYFNTEDEAKQAYLDAKKIYHNINVIEM